MFVPTSQVNAALIDLHRGQSNAVRDQVECFEYDQLRRMLKTSEKVTLYVTEQMFGVAVQTPFCGYNPIGGCG